MDGGVKQTNKGVKTLVTLENKLPQFPLQSRESRNYGRDIIHGEPVSETQAVVSEPQEANSFTILFASGERSERLEADKTFQEIYDAASEGKCIGMSAPERHFIGFPTAVQFDEENSEVKILLRAAETDDGWVLMGTANERPYYCATSGS